MIVRFEGGPANGYEAVVIGRDEAPTYFKVIRSPEDVSSEFIVVGVDFDDAWPEQLHYEWQEDLKTETAPGVWDDLAVYVFVAAP